MRLIHRGVCEEESYDGLYYGFGGIVGAVVIGAGEHAGP